MGHVCMIILVFLCQTIVYREVTRLFALMDSKPVEYGGKDPWSKTLSWYFFATANYFLYGESIIHYFKVPIHLRSHVRPSHAFDRSMSSSQKQTSSRSPQTIGSSALPSTQSASWGLLCH
jgi:Cytidylyltransferase family